MVLSVTLKAPLHAVKRAQCLLYRCIGDAQRHGHGDCGQCVAHIVLTAEIEDDVQRGQRAALHPEMHLTVYRAHIHGADLGLSSQTIGADAAMHLGGYGAQSSIVAAQHGGAVKRQAVKKIDKSLLQTAKVLAIGLHMVGIDIGHDGQYRQQVQKGGVGLIGLGHQVLATAQSRRCAGAAQACADHKAGVQPGLD